MVATIKAKKADKRSQSLAGNLFLSLLNAKKDLFQRL